MPLIHESFVKSVFFLYRTAEDAKVRAKNGGTGFFVRVKDGPDEPEFIYAVANWHVVGIGGAGVARLNTPDGTGEVLADLSWTREQARGDDLAVARVGLSAEHFSYSAIDADLVMGRAEPGKTEDDARRIFGPGNEVFFIGRHAEHEGRGPNDAMVRFGTIAQMPSDEWIYNEGIGCKQESYILEARSIGGFSGSPVFVNPQAFIDENGQWSFQMNATTQKIRMTFLLGVVWGHENRWTNLRDETRKRKLREWVPENSGLLYAVPSWVLLDALMSEEEVEVRKHIVEAKTAENMSEDRQAVADSIQESDNDRLTKAEEERGKPGGRGQNLGG
jgi:hypothetical protein